MNTSTEYLKGVTDTLIENFEFHTGGLDDHNRLSINFEDFYGSAKKRIGCKVKIYFPTDIRRDIDGDEVVKDYFEQDIVVYNSDKLGSFIADFETELSKVRDLNIKMR